jgi:hypothetical protein
MSKDQYAVSALNTLKDDTILLTSAKDYLGTDSFLIKTGNSIGHAVEVLKRDISSIKKQYPGKMMNDVDTDSMLERIDDIARRMLRPDKGLMDQHISGQLGREMGVQVSAVTKAVKTLRNKVYGIHSDYDGKMVSTDLSEAIQGTFQSASRMAILGLKALACIVILAGAVFCYLCITMQKEGGLLKEIASSRGYIAEQKALIPKMTVERDGLSTELNAITSGEMTRQEKVSALETGMKINKINDALKEIETDIALKEKRLAETQKDLEELRKKPFFKRLFRQ